MTKLRSNISRRHFIYLSWRGNSRGGLFINDDFFTRLVYQGV